MDLAFIEAETAQHNDADNSQNTTEATGARTLSPNMYDAGSLQRYDKLCLLKLQYGHCNVFYENEKARHTRSKW